MHKGAVFTGTCCCLFLFLICQEGREVVFAQEQPGLPSLRDRMFQDSVAAWKRLKQERGDSYIYTRSSHSFAGFSGITLVRVKEGQVVKRQHDGVKRLEDGTIEMVKWDEYGEEIGSHPEGFPARTVDELYFQCREEVLTRNPATNRIVFKTDKRGIMQFCTYSPQGMVDDNVIGIRLKSLQFFR